MNEMKLIEIPIPNICKISGDLRLQIYVIRITYSKPIA